MEREAERRTPSSLRERELRLGMIATPIIESDEPVRISSFAREAAELAAAAAAEH